MFEVEEKTFDYCHAIGRDKKRWSTHDKYNYHDIFLKKIRSRTNARMLSFSIMSDENNAWNLQDARNSVESLFNQMRRQKEEEKQRPVFS